MIEQRPEQHLTYDDLLKAVAQTDDVSPESREHLKDCAQCTQAIRRIEQRYTRIGRLAKQLAPEPVVRFRLPAQQTTASRWRLKPVAALGLAAALLMAFSLWMPRYFGRPGAPPQMTAQSLEKDRQLMQDVDALVNNALPASFQEMASFNDPVSDDDMINWVVPSIDDEDNSLT
jgi:hypothetical protein